MADESQLRSKTDCCRMAFWEEGYRSRTEGGRQYKNNWLDMKQEVLFLEVLKGFLKTRRETLLDK